MEGNQMAEVVLILLVEEDSLTEKGEAEEVVGIILIIGLSVRFVEDRVTQQLFAIIAMNVVHKESIAIMLFILLPCRLSLQLEAHMISLCRATLLSRVTSISFIDDFWAANLPPASSPFCSGFGPNLAVFFSGWKAPPAAVFKLNVDASCDVLFGCSGLGVAMRNATGIVVFAAAVPLKFCTDVEVAEARAILAGIQLAAERGLLPLLVETDSLNISRLCNGDLLSKSDVENIIFDIQSLMSSLNIASISFISMLGNGVAHGIAKRAFDLDVPCLWTCSFPVWLSKLFQVNIASFSSPISE
ncbi:hypothetical protein ACOSQ2_007375 [Xanthoceras sorbifolium]